MDRVLSSADCLPGGTTKHKAFGHGSRWSLPELLANAFSFPHWSPQNSIIHGTNQDGFIQRAINASNAYASIIGAVKDAESAANEANRAAGEALTVRGLFPSSGHLSPDCGLGAPQNWVV